MRLDDLPRRWSEYYYPRPFEWDRFIRVPRQPLHDFLVSTWPDTFSIAKYDPPSERPAAPIHFIKLAGQEDRVRSRPLPPAAAHWTSEEELLLYQLRGCVHEGTTCTVEMLRWVYEQVWRKGLPEDGVIRRWSVGCDSLEKLLGEATGWGKIEGEGEGSQWMMVKGVDPVEQGMLKCLVPRVAKVTDRQLILARWLIEGWTVRREMLGREIERVEGEKVIRESKLHRYNRSKEGCYTQ